MPPPPAGRRGSIVGAMLWCSHLGVLRIRVVMATLCNVSHYSHSFRGWIFHLLYYLEHMNLSPWFEARCVSAGLSFLPFVSSDCLFHWPLRPRTWIDSNFTEPGSCLIRRRQTSSLITCTSIYISEVYKICWNLHLLNCICIYDLECCLQNKPRFGVLYRLNVHASPIWGPPLYTDTHPQKIPTPDTYLSQWRRVKKKLYIYICMYI